MIFLQYVVKLYLIGAFSYKIWESIMGFLEGEILFWLTYGLYGLIFLFFSIIYRPSKDANTSPVAIFVVLSHIISPLFFGINEIPSRHVLMVAYLFMSAGFLISVFSLLDLGRSFDVFPVHRKIVTKGMYQYIRHPIYLGYIITAIGALVSGFSSYNLLIFSLLIVLTIARISLEEKELLKDWAYQLFKNEVPYRIFPKVY